MSPALQTDSLPSEPPGKPMHSGYAMRSYQYYAANKISDKVSKTMWEEKNIYGGYIWHTTGSGKTMTSFKSAQLIANSKDADKVVFLMDRSTFLC